MIGPAFISAPESASPQSSITPGNARPMTRERVILQPQRQHAGRQPLRPDRDRDLVRSVLAREPRQACRSRRTPHRRGCRRRARPSRKCRSRTCRAAGTRPVRPLRCGAERARDIVLRGRGGRAEDQFGVAHRRGDVVRHQRQLRLVPPAKILHRDDAAGRVVCLHGFDVAPPQPHVVTGKRHVARRRERAIAAAEHCDAHQLRPVSRSTKCCTLPIALRGSASTNTYSRGTLKRASCVSRCASSARASHAAFGRRTT